MTEVNPIGALPLFVENLSTRVLVDAKSLLIDEMLKRNEDVSDNELWKLRRRQLFNCIATDAEFDINL